MKTPASTALRITFGEKPQLLPHILLKQCASVADNLPAVNYILNAVVIIAY